MQNPIGIVLYNLGIALFFFEKPGFLSEKLKTLMSSNYHKVQYFLLKLRIRSLLTNTNKMCLGFFLFSLDLQLFAKIKKKKKTWFLHTRF